MWFYPNSRFDFWHNCTTDLVFSRLLSPHTGQTLQCPTMSFISALLQQTIYLGMPDDSVRNCVSVLLLLRLSQTACSPLFFFSPPPPLFLRLVRVEKFHQAVVLVRGAERSVWHIQLEEGMRGEFLKGEQRKEGEADG